MSKLLTDSPSLANASGTLLDSACKHIQQCRVSYDHMLDFVDNPYELEKNKMQYCVHKDEMVVGITRGLGENKDMKRFHALRHVVVSTGRRS